jgi:hypothetical protein
VGRTTGSLTAALARDVPLYIRSRAEKYIRSGRAAVIEWADAHKRAGLHDRDGFPFHDLPSVKLYRTEWEEL